MPHDVDGVGGHGGEKTEKIYSIWVGDLHHRVSDFDLKSKFSRFGRVHSAKAIIEKRSNLHKGYGFVNFYDEATKDAAVANHQSVRFYGVACTVRDQGRRDSDMVCNRLRELKENTCLFVGNLPDNLPQKELSDRLQEIAGEHISIRMKSCFCFVTYKTHAEAQAALEKLKGEAGYIRDRKFRVQFTSESGAKRKRYSTGNDSAAQFQNRALRVKNLAPSVTEVDLFNRFKAYGYILNLDVWNNDGSMLPRHTAIVHFKNVYAAQKAVEEMNGVTFHEKAITVSTVGADEESMMRKRGWLDNLNALGGRQLPHQQPSSGNSPELPPRGGRHQTSPRIPRSLPTNGSHRHSTGALTTSPPMAPQQRAPRSIGALPSSSASNGGGGAARLPEPFQDPPPSILSDPVLGGGGGNQPLTAAQMVQRGLRKEAAAAAAAASGNHSASDGGSILMSPPQSRQSSSGAPRRLVPNGNVDVRDVRNMRDIRDIRTVRAAARDVRDPPTLSSMPLDLSAPQHRPVARPPLHGARGTTSPTVNGVGMRKRSLSDRDLTALAAAAAAGSHQEQRSTSTGGASLGQISFDKPTTAMQFARPQSDITGKRFSAVVQPTNGGARTPRRPLSGGSLNILGHNGGSRRSQRSHGGALTSVTPPPLGADPMDLGSPLATRGLAPRDFSSRSQLNSRHFDDLSPPAIARSQQQGNPMRRSPPQSVASTAPPQMPASGSPPNGVDIRDQLRERERNAPLALDLSRPSSGYSQQQSSTSRSSSARVPRSSRDHMRSHMALGLDSGDYDPSAQKLESAYNAPQNGYHQQLVNRASTAQPQPPLAESQFDSRHFSRAAPVDQPPPRTSTRPTLSINTELPLNTALFPQTPVNASYPRVRTHVHNAHHVSMIPPDTPTNILDSPMYWQPNPTFASGQGGAHLHPPPTPYHPMSLPTPARHGAYGPPSGMHTPTGAPAGAAGFGLGIGGFSRYGRPLMDPKDFATHSPQHRVPFNELPSFFGPGGILPGA